jgi:hypothetical protein
MQKRIGKSVRHDVKQGVTLVWLFGMLLLFAACSQRQMQPPVEPEVTIQFSTNSTTGMNDLNGAVVSGSIQIAVTEGRNIKEVRFFLDDATGSGTPAGVDAQAPFEWLLDTTLLANGPHTLMVMGFGTNQKGKKLSEASFTVSNTVTEPAPTEPAPTEPTPEEPAPTEPTPEEPAPVEPQPDPEPAPTEPAPEEPTPEEPTPTEPEPEPTPEEPAPVEPQPDPGPAPTEPDPEQPVVPVARSWTLRGDPAFSVDQLTPEQKLWYGRTWAGIRNPNAVIDITSRASSDNIYHYGRDLHTYTQAVLLMLRSTGDLKFLDEVDRIAQLMRSKLSDSWCATLDGTSQRDGYLNWRERHEQSSTYYCKDVTDLNEMLTHAHVATFAYAFHVNRDLDPRYAERADFWRNYLVNHFEPKWRKRKNKPWPQMPLLQKKGVKTQMSWIRYNYYMGLLTGRTEYLAEAERLGNDMLDNDFRVVRSAGGDALVWRSTMLSQNGDRPYLMPTTYTRYVMINAVELHLEGFHRWADGSMLPQMTNSLGHFVFDNGTIDIARDIGGGISRGGIAASPEDEWRRYTAMNFLTGPYMMTIAWDTNGRAQQISERFFRSKENVDNPRTVYYPIARFLQESR